MIVQPLILALMSVVVCATDEPPEVATTATDISHWQENIVWSEVIEGGIEIVIHKATQGMIVHLTFLAFEVEDETDCTYDYVEVFSGMDSSGPSYGKFCGNANPTAIFSVTEALLVRFQTDDTIVSKGFSASYMAMEQLTDEDLTEDGDAKLEDSEEDAT